MIWYTSINSTHHWVERLPLSRAELICQTCWLSRPILSDWLSYPHHCPPWLEAR